jgi:hypothetical protein
LNRRRLRRFLLLAILVAAGCGSDGGGLSTEQDAKLEAMTLRLADLPEGFVRGDDSGCGGTATTEGGEPVVDDFLIETRPELPSLVVSYLCAQARREVTGNACASNLRPMWISSQ